MFNIISRRTLLEAIGKHPQAKVALLQWYHELLNAEFNNFNEVKAIYKNASLVGDDRVVFNIKGNQYRLVVRIVFLYKTIQIKWFGTHKAYDQIDVMHVPFKKK